MSTTCHISRKAGSRGLLARPSRMTGIIGRFRFAICPNRDSTSSSCHGPAPRGPMKTAADLIDLSCFCSSLCQRVPGWISQISSQGRMPRSFSSSPTCGSEFAKPGGGGWASGDAGAPGLLPTAARLKRRYGTGVSARQDAVKPRVSVHSPVLSDVTGDAFMNKWSGCDGRERGLGPPRARDSRGAAESRKAAALLDNRSVRKALVRTGRWIWSVRRLMLPLGALLVLAFPAPNLEFLAWFGLVPGLLVIIRSPSAREGGIRAWWLGAGYLIAALYWMAPEIGPGVLLVAAVMGVLWVPFGVAAWKLLRPPLSWPRALAALVVVPSCWLLTEWLRSWQALGGPWAVFGASQWQHPAVLALAAVGGVWLISFALVLANVAIALITESIPRLGRTTLRPGYAVLGAAVALASVGAGPLAFALTPASPAAREATVALVQPGIVSNAVQRVDASERLTAELSSSGELSGVKPDLIVWGESSTAVDLTLAGNRAQLDEMEKLAKEDGADLLVNQDTTVPGQGQEKVGVLVSPAGIRGRYIKTRLVPFGEYIPFRQQHGWLGAVRAAETGRPVVQAALTGVTAAFDARGRLLAWMGQSSHGVVSVRLGLPAASARTIYDQFGDYVLWSALAVVIAGALVMVANSRGFPGRSAGAKGGHEAQYVAGQSVPS